MLSTDTKNSQPLVAVVILNWNGRNFLEKFLPFVLGSSYENKVVYVADNASTDDSVQFLRKNYSDVKVIVNERNEGFAQGYNTALRQIKADYYVLLNSDVEVEPFWINNVVELMEADKQIAVCQPKILSYSRRNMFEYAGACGGWVDNLFYPFARGRVFEDCEVDTGQYNDAAPCFWATGAAMFVRANLYHELGGLDPYFFAHMEEIDFCWRVQTAGYKVYVQPKSVVYHVGGGTLPKGNSRKVFLNFRNSLIMMHKNLFGIDALVKIFSRLVLDGVAAVRSIFSGESILLPVLRAHFAYYKWILADQGQSVFPKSKTGKVAGGYKGNIVFQYFIKGKKTFKEIVGNN